MPRSIHTFFAALCCLLPAVLDAAPQAYWPFEESSGTVAIDATGNGHDGVLVSGAERGDGTEGLGVRFPGAGDAVEVTPIGTLGQLQQVSISAWVRQSYRGEFTSIVDARDSAVDGYDLYFSNTGRLFMRVNSSTLSGATVVADDTWRHLVGVWDGFSLSLYVDGALDATSTIPATTVDVTAPLLFGRHFASHPSWEASGSLDEVRIYDYALDASEVLTLFQGSDADTTAPLRSNGRPTGLLPAGTAAVTLEVATNEAAECRWSELPGTAFESMGNVFATTGGQDHATVLGGLADGETHTVHLRCADPSGNANADDLIVEWTIDTVAPGEPGLIGHWPFEDLGAIAVDLSGNGHDATLRGGATFGSGHSGGGLDLTSAGDYAEVAADALLDQPAALTLAAWVRQAPRGEFSAIIDKRDSVADGYDLFLDDLGRSFVRVNDATLPGTLNVADGAWHHLAAVWDGTRLALYVDGQPDVSRPVAVTHVDVAAPLFFGRHFENNPQWELAGSLDDVRIYDRALSAAEIQALAGSSVPLLDLSPDFPDRHVIQRVGTTADLPLAGSYVGHPTQIQARLVDALTGDHLPAHDWTAVDPAPSAGEWSGVLANVPEGGWYRLELRFANDPSVTLTPANRLGVGMIVAALGQSSMAKVFTEITFTGDGDPDLASQDTPDGLTYRYGYGNPRISASALGGYLRQAPNPGTPTYGDVTGAAGIRFANRLAAALNIPILVLDFAIDGTSILEWTDPHWIGRQNFDAALATVGGDFEVFVWFQAAADILSDLPAATYLDRLNLFYDQIQAQLPAGRTLEFFEAIQGRGDYPQSHDASYAAIRKVQLEWPQQRAHVHPAGTAIDLHLAADTFHRDDGHFTASQYQVMADRFSSAILDLLAVPGYTGGVAGPRIADAVRAGTRVTVTFSHDRGTALTLPDPSADIEGFELSEDGFQTVLRLGQGILSAELSADQQSVVLELASIPDGTVELRYLYGMNPFAHKGGAAQRRARCNTVFDDFQYHPERSGLPVHPTTEDLLVAGGS